MTDSVKSFLTQRPWSSGVDARLAWALQTCNVPVEPIDPVAVRLRAVPLSPHFSKLRTNLLIHRAGDQIRVYVDIDLAYHGPDHSVRAALDGPRDRNWRQLAMAVSVDDVGQVVRATLETLGSPVLAVLETDADKTKRPSVDGPLDANSILAAETSAVAPEDLAAAFKSSVRKSLAQRMAMALSRNPPCGGVVWAAAGSGKGHFVRTTAHILLHNQHVSSVRQMTAARLTCGRVFLAERDGVLAALLDEMAAQPGLLLLVDHLDLGISGTTASLSLLADALDRGVRLLATVQDENFLRDVQEVPALTRRLLPVKIPSLNRDETLKVLRDLARKSGCEVSPAAILAAIQITERQGTTQPAAAIDLLKSAMAEAQWRPHKTITPDDVTSVIEPNWPT